MKTRNKRLVVVLVTIGGILILAVSIALMKHDKKAESWNTAVEGYLAVPTPCCAQASLWGALDAISDDGQRARPASPAEVARWLDHWPYRSREDHDRPDAEQLSVALQSREVRCSASPKGGEIPQHGDDEETLEAIRHRRECTYAKWKVWAGETASERRNERHTVWVDDDGFFHGRVDYWQAE